MIETKKNYWDLENLQEKLVNPLKDLLRFSNEVLE